MTRLKWQILTILSRYRFGSMVRDERLMDRLLADLNFHNFIGAEQNKDHRYDISESDDLGIIFRKLYESAATSSFLFDNTHVHFTEKHKKRVQQYIDDVTIDYFFRTNNFLPIVFSQEECPERIMESGCVETSGNVVLDISDVYDRCTFVETISRLITYEKVIGISYENPFCHNVYPRDVSYGAVGGAVKLDQHLPFGEMFDAYLDFLYGDQHSKFNPRNRAQSIYLFADFYKKHNCEHLERYSFLSSFGLLQMQHFIDGFMSIKNSHIWGDYTFEEILWIYALLVEKLELHYESISTVLAQFGDMEPTNTSVLEKFFKYEGSIMDSGIIEPYIKIDDLYLRFTSRTKGSKAFKFYPCDNRITEIQKFNEPRIRTADGYNTLPLPYLYNELKTK